MRNTFNIEFYCRKSKALKDGTAPIEASISINGVRKFVNLPIKCTPEDFSKKRKPKQIQAYIDLMRQRVTEIVTEMLREGEPVTTDRLLAYIRTGGYKSYTVEDLCNDALALVYKRNITPNHKRKYELIRDRLYTYIDKSEEVTKITPALIQYIKEDMYGRYEKETASGYMSKLKYFITYGVDNNKIKINPFQNIKIEKGHKPIQYLTQADINKLRDYQTDNKSMSAIRDCALFQIGSGLSYCDCIRLTQEDVQCHNGTYYISKERQKTGTTFTAPLLPCAVEVWNKYNGQLPFISNQKYNLYLKDLQRLTNIETNLHTHLFRHTYCTLLYNAGVRIETVAKAAGHSNSKITQQFYAHLLDTTVIDEISKVLK